VLQDADNAEEPEDDKPKKKRAPAKAKAKVGNSLLGIPFSEKVPPGTPSSRIPRLSLGLRGLEPALFGSPGLCHADFIWAQIIIPFSFLFSKMNNDQRD
jgi:hypothetical protein